MLRFTCPCCGAVNEIDALVQHEYGRKAVVAAAQLPPALFAQSMRYLRLFVSASAPQRSLTMDRAATLLDDLVQAVNAGKVEAKGREWSAPLAAWSPAMDVIFERVDGGLLKTPLRTHAYLFGIISNQANDQEAKTEAATEQAKRHKPSVDAAPSDAAIERETDDIPDYVKAAFAKLGNKSMQAVSATQAALDAPADPLLGQLACISKGKWKGKGGTIVRVVGDQVYVAVQFPRNGLQTIPFNRSELSL